VFWLNHEEAKRKQAAEDRRAVTDREADDRRAAIDRTIANDSAQEQALTSYLADRHQVCENLRWRIVRRMNS
jgi:hypothetical protein